jgi:phenylacetate-CoA ligase
MAVTMRGYYLRRWRYGPDSLRLMDEALERDHWSPQQWQLWQEERLAFVLHHAANRVPYYRAYWRRRRRHGDRASWETLGNWPILRKSAVQQDPRAFIAEGCNPRGMFIDRTSGTTGTPLSIYIARQTLRRWYALFNARLRMWHGILPTERWAMLGGQMVVPPRRQQPPYWVFNRALNQLYMSTYHISHDNAERYVRALHKYAPSHIVAYPSSLASLATAMIDRGLQGPRLKAAFSNAEALLDWQRAAIVEALGCAVRDTYGMAEMVAAASECRHGTMHIWPEAGRIEIVGDGDDEPVECGRVGRIVATGLLNADMPLIRYETGDRGAVGSPVARCACGRNLPALSSIEGRSADMLVTPEGRQIFWINPVFYGLRVREAQVIQESLERLRVLYVPGPGHALRDDELLIARLRERIGNVEVALEPVAHIAKEPNGKFRSVVSHVTGAARESSGNLAQSRRQ